MNDVRDRLVQCFAAVFPDLAAAEIPRAAMTSVDSWESVSTVTLVAVVEEVFGIEVAPEDLELFVSFERILDYLQRRSAGAA